MNHDMHGFMQKLKTSIMSELNSFRCSRAYISYASQQFYSDFSHILNLASHTVFSIQYFFNHTCFG